jgi:hypothetical protein
MSAIEQLGANITYEQENPAIPESVQRYIDGGFSRETKEGTLTYDLLCGVMKSDDGSWIIIRKDLNLDSENPKDWLVVTCKPGENPIEEVILTSETIYSEDGDGIKIEFASYLKDCGNYEVEFGVNPMYEADGNTITTRLLQPGGALADPSLVDDKKFNIRAVEQPSAPPLAEVIDLAGYRSRSVGSLALKN